MGGWGGGEGDGAGCPVGWGRRWDGPWLVGWSAGQQRTFCHSTASTPSGAASPPTSDAAGQMRRWTVIRPFGICETHCMDWCTRSSHGSEPASSAIVRKGEGGARNLSGKLGMSIVSGMPWVPVKRPESSMRRTAYSSSSMPRPPTARRALSASRWLRIFSSCCMCITSVGSGCHCC